MIDSLAILGFCGAALGVGATDDEIPALYRQMLLVPVGSEPLLYVMKLRAALAEIREIRRQANQTEEQP